MLTFLLYGYFVISLIILGLGVYYTATIIRVRTGGNVVGKPKPPMLGIAIFVLLFGLLGAVASAPVIFTDNPTWLTDKIFFVVNWIISLF
jgi:hypothetical protein